MRTPLLCLFALAAVASLGDAAEQRSWNRVRYVGGAIPINASQYDWNATLTITLNPGALTLTVAPSSIFRRQQTVQLKASQIVSVVVGPGAWPRVTEFSGVQLPPRPQALFGLLQEHGFIGILYRGDDGKPGAILLDSYAAGQIGRTLETLTGKALEYAK
jgi:hypothetical protein